MTDKKIEDKKRVCVVTGSRAEYGLLKPVMEKIRESEKLELQILVTGMHLESEFGLTVKNIKADSFKIGAEVPIKMDADTKRSMAEAIGLGIIDISKAFDRLDPHIVVILGDRFEILATAIAASYGGRVLAHISCGDKTQAGYDEYTRHAITKMAHLHFPSTERNAKRVIKMGEDSKYVFNVGSTAIDTILNKELPSKEAILKKYNLDEKKPIFLVVQHPMSTSPDEAEKEMRTTIEALEEFDANIVGIYPNIDPGGRRMIKVLKGYEKKNPKVKWHESLPFEEYLGIMKIADVMIGNSSSGIIESPSFHLPVVNIGPRQRDRERAANVMDVPYEKEEIVKAIKKMLYDEEFKEMVKNCKTPYGNGSASTQIVKVLNDIKIDKKLLEKQITLD